MVTGEMVVATHDELVKIFIGNNMKLISDVWAPILDVVPDGFLLLQDNQHWADYFTRVTTKILGCILTSFFRLPNPDGAIKAIVAAAGTASPYKFPLKDLSLHKGDEITPPSGWPKLLYPDSAEAKGEKKWIRCKVKVWGSLKYPAITSGLSFEEIEHEIMEACIDPSSDQPYPEPPPGVPVQLADAGNSAIASWLIERINIDIDLLTKQIIELSEKRQGFLNTVQDIETWLHERHKVILVR